MCVAALKSVMDCTHIGVWDIDHPGYGYRHVLTYQNRVKNLAGLPNCMLLHIPSKEPLTPENLVDLSEYTELLRDLYEYIDPIEEREKFICMDASPTKDRTNYIVEQGVYHIVLLNNLEREEITKVLEQVPASKRPDLSDELIGFFKKHFPDFPLALCCFDTEDAAQSAPIMIHYPPKYPDTLMANTLDSHGGAPRINTLLDFHQHIFFGTYKQSVRKDSPLKKVPDDFYPELAAFLPKTVGLLDTTEFGSINLPNKDVCIDLKSIRAEDPPNVTLELLGSTEKRHKTDIVRKAFWDFETLKSTPNSIFGIADCYPRR